MTNSRSLSTTPLALAVAAALALTACGGSDDASGDDAAASSATVAAETETETATETEAAPASDAAGIRVVSADDAAATIASAPDDLIILDIRTAEEFAEGHIDGAEMLDFYRDDFAEQLATFDPDVPYVLYCRSGNRSSQARAIMTDLGFTDVEDIEGGVVGWAAAGLPLVTN